MRAEIPEPGRGRGGFVPPHARFARPGFVLPLALFLALTTALLVALLLEGAVQELRISRGDLAAARAQAAAGSALSDWLASSPDSALLALPRGAISASAITRGSDTTRISLQSLGGGMIRLQAASRSWSGGVRADAVTLGFARLVPDSGGSPGRLRFSRLPGWWWAQLP